MVVSEQGWGWHVGRALIRPCLPIDTIGFSYISLFKYITKEAELVIFIYVGF